jgi:hypothetical protein
VRVRLKTVTRVGSPGPTYPWTGQALSCSNCTDPQAGGLGRMIAEHVSSHPVRRTIVLTGLSTVVRVGADHMAHALFPHNGACQAVERLKPVDVSE